MAYTEIKNVSFFRRLKDSIKGVFFGILLFAVSFPLLYWNEGRAVRRADGLKEGGKAVVTVSADKVDSQYEGFLVHTTGEAKSEKALEDKDFSLFAKDALRLERKVEMFLWKETKSEKRRKKVGGGEEITTTYSYDRVWSQELIDSRRFKERGHDNPTSMPYRSWTSNDLSATLGAFRLGELVTHLTAWEPFPVSEGEFEPPSVSPTEVEPELDGNTVEEDPSLNLEEEEVTEDTDKLDPFANKERARADRRRREEAQARRRAYEESLRQQEAERRQALQAEKEREYNLAVQRREIEKTVRQQKLSHLKPHNGGYYQGKNPDSPEVGDVRISFAVVKEQPVSLLGRQQGDGFVPYTVGDTDIYRIEPGEKTADEMFGQMEAENAQTTWILRGVGFFVMFIGLVSIFRPFVVVADVIPLFGNLLNKGVGLFSFLLAAPLTLATIAVGWFAARPLISVGLAAGALVFVFLAFKAGRKKR